MTFNPNDRNPVDPMQPRRNSPSRWPMWAGVIVVVLVAAFAWSKWGGNTGRDGSATTNPPTPQPRRLQLSHQRHRLRKV